MENNRMELVKLDQINGDGDLGISMADGFAAAYDQLNTDEDKDIGRLFNSMANRFNEAAPSSLGTVVTFIFKGMARSLKGKEENCTALEMAEAIKAGLENVTAKTGSQPGQKTILDSLYPAVEVLLKDPDDPQAYEKAAAAAREGSNSTAQMKAVWGRAAYYGEKSIGVIGGGSVAGALIFEAIDQKDE